MLGYYARHIIPPQYPLLGLAFLVILDLLVDLFVDLGIVLVTHAGLVRLKVAIISVWIRNCPYCRGLPPYQHLVITH